jgi:RHS repeat-associated protein
LTEVELPNHGKRVLEPWALKNVLNDKESSPQNLLDFPFLDNVLKSPKYMESLVTFEDGRQEKYATGNGLSWKYENDKLREKTTYADLERNLLPINIERGDSGWETSQISYNDDWQVMKILSDLRDNIWYEEDYNDNNAAPYYPGSSDWNMHISGTTIEYNEQRLVAKVTKSSRDIQTFTYDANGRVIEMENTYPQLGKLTKYDYNDDGDMIKVTYPDGKINEMTYNARGLVMEVKNNDGSKTTMERDSRGDVIAMTDEMNRRVELRRDIMGRVLQEKSPSGKEVEYQWGGAGCAACGDGSKLTRITDASDHVWEFKYDVMGNPLKMIYPDGSSITQEYDIAGRLKKFFNKRGQEISYNYDNFGKLLKKTTPGGDINFTYDVRDRISDITGSDFHYYYRYGNTNYSMRLVEEKDANSGNWNQQITNFFGLPDKTFDNFGWNKRYVYNFAITPVGPTPFNLIYSKRYISKHLQSFYTYDNGLRPVKKYDSTFDNEKYNYYDSNGLLRRIYYKSFSNPTLYSTGSLDFSRDTSGLIAGLTGDKQLNATYDSDLQINSIQHTLPRPFDESYTYDDNGNRLTSLNNSFTYDDLNRLTESASHNYEYDADGNMTSEKNKLTGETKKYYYNSENRMIKYEHLASDISPIDITAEYKYDIYGRRIQKNMNGAITSFTWEGDSLSMELNSSNQPIRKYFTENGMDEYIGHLEYSEVSDWTKIFDVWNNQGMYSYIKDQVGTVYKVWDHSTKQVADSRAYDSFGNLVNQTGTTKTPLGFQGKYYDAESGLNYFYHRYYNPAIGRFTSEDPIGFGGGMNFYGFVGNNPIGFFDLFGMEKSCHRITDWVPSTVMESAGNKGRLVRSFEQIQWSLQNQSNPAPFVSSQMPRGARTGQLIFSCRYVGSLIKTSIYEKLRLYEAKFECHDDCNSWTETQNKSQAEQYSKSIQEPTIGSLTKTRILWYPCPNFLVEDL